MMVRKNTDVRLAIKKSGFTHWLIAEHLGISDITFSRWLRRELPDEKKKDIYETIETLRSEGDRMEK